MTPFILWWLYLCFSARKTRAPIFGLFWSVRLLVRELDCLAPASSFARSFVLACHGARSRARRGCMYLVLIRWDLHGLTCLIKCQMALRTARFESEYAAISGHTTQLLDAEKSRVKHIEQLLLQFENDALRSGLDQANEQLAKITKTESDARLQLHEIYKENDRLRNIAQLSSHESQGLRVSGAWLLNPHNCWFHVPLNLLNRRNSHP